MPNEYLGSSPGQFLKVIKLLPSSYSEKMDWGRGLLIDSTFKQLSTGIFKRTYVHCQRKTGNQIYQG